MASIRKELGTLKRLITQADEIVADPSLYKSSNARCRELLRSAQALTDDLIQQTTAPAMAAQLGRVGGKKTALRGSEYFRELATKRKTHGGGRPRGDS